jgi:hypothetical protein
MPIRGGGAHPIAIGTTEPNGRFYIGLWVKSAESTLFGLSLFTLFAPVSCRSAAYRVATLSTMLASNERCLQHFLIP